MKKLLTILALLISVSVMGQKLQHNGFINYYNPAIGQSDSTYWTLNASMVNCTKKISRTNVFIADPAIPGSDFNIFYAGSGYDRGHQFDANDASCDPLMAHDCWFFSNMVPQCPNLNRITWRGLEAYCNTLAKKYTLTITSGVKGSIGKLVGVDGKKVKHPSNINIPEFCWKRISYNGKTEYYIMPNRDTVSRHKFDYYKVK